jgi:DNA-binding transcriptional ArsR family regulator
VTRPESDGGRRPATDAEARALASTIRLRILRACLGEPHTNKEIAGALGKDPATILHHVRTLVDTGFLEAQEVRRGTRGSREIPYLATGKSWQMETPAKDSAMLNAFLEEVALVPVEEVDTMRAGLRLTAERREELSRRFTALVEEYFENEDPDGEACSVFLSIHPDPNRT